MRSAPDGDHTPPPARHVQKGDHVRLAYAKGLDGVRALAVVAVLLYHLGTTGVLLAGGTKAFVPGGFLGVDVFFVLSGDRKSVV